MIAIRASHLRRAARAVAGVAALALGACSMAESVYVSPVGSVSCHSQGGSYYLSKSHLTVTVNREETVAADGKTPGPDNYVLAGVGVSAQPDRTQLYCLDYNSSPTANDTLIIEKTPSNLLSKITSDAEDRSAEIWENLIQAVFVAISQNPEFDRTLTTRTLTRLPPRTAGSHVKVTFDPFDDHQTDIANDALRHTGFCLLLERHDRQHRAVVEGIDRYCDNPTGRLTRDQRLHEATGTWDTFSPPVLAGPMSARQRGEVHHARHDHGGVGAREPIVTQGVFYRPRVAHSAVLFVKKNLKAAGGWQLRSRASLMLENISPTIAVGIDRSFFAKRRTTIVMDNGVLQDISITKGSELLGFVSIPLQISQSITALPANIIQVRIQDTNNRAKLIAAQEQLLKTKRDLRDYQATLQPASAPLPTAPGVQRSLAAVDDGSTQPVLPGGRRSATGDADPDTRDSAVAEGAGTDMGSCVTQCMRPGESTQAACQKFCRCKVTCTSKSATPGACNTFCGQGGN